MDTMSVAAPRIMVLREDESCECGSSRYSLVVGSRTSDGSPVFMWDRHRPHDIPDGATPAQARRMQAHQPEYVAMDRPLDVTCCPACDGQMAWMPQQEER